MTNSELGLQAPTLVFFLFFFFGPDGGVFVDGERINNCAGGAVEYLRYCTNLLGLGGEFARVDSRRVAKKSGTGGD